MGTKNELWKWIAIFHLKIISDQYYAMFGKSRSNVGRYGGDNPTWKSFDDGTLAKWNKQVDFKEEMSQGTEAWNNFSVSWKKCEVANKNAMR